MATITSAARRSGLMAWSALTISREATVSSCSAGAASASSVSSDSIAASPRLSTLRIWSMKR
ncbi:hypothetical protein D9M72_646630 [compost metagenome]